MQRLIIKSIMSNDPNKKVFIALQPFYGIGLNSSLKILTNLGLTLNSKIKDLTTNDLLNIETILKKNYLIETEARNKQTNNIIKLIKINSYRGKCHMLGYPVHGQRTHSNAKSQRVFKYSLKDKNKIEN